MIESMTAGIAGALFVIAVGLVLVVIGAIGEKIREVWRTLFGKETDD